MALKFISPKAHAVLDYASVAIQAIAPRLLGMERQAGRVHKAVLTATAGYSLLTRYPGGAYKVLPMQAHLALDALAGVGFLAAAFVKRHDRAARFTLAGMGLLSLTAAFCTKTPSYTRPAGLIGRMPSRGESTIHRYARERLPGPSASVRTWPEFLQRQVMSASSMQAAQV